MNYAKAMNSIRDGQHILVRGAMAQPADPEIANAIAIEGAEQGMGIRYKLIDGLGSRDLQAMANGPIMDPNRIFLPAGKCSEDEMRRREA